MDETPSAAAGPPADEPPGGPLDGPGPTEPGPDGPVDDTRRYPSTIGGVCYLAILTVFVAGLVLASLGTWRTGIRISAGSLMVASVLRLALPRRDAGMLAVRHRVVDALVLAGSAAALLFLAATIPDQPM